MFSFGELMGCIDGKSSYYSYYTDVVGLTGCGEAYTWVSVRSVKNVRIREWIVVSIGNWKLEISYRN